MTLDPIQLDLDGMRRNLRREGTPPRVFFFEHGEADNFKNDVDRRFDLSQRLDPNDAHFSEKREVALQRFLGHEVFRIWLPGAEFKVAGSRGTAWAEEHAGPIQSWDDLERYDWPDAEAIDYGQLEWLDANLPDDMGVVHVTKIWEVVRELLGFETYCIRLREDPALVREILRRVGEFHMSLTRALCDAACVFAVYGADDYAYKTATMMAPDVIREQFLPWHRRMADEAHGRGKLYFMHVCGKVDSIMDDMIDDVRIDAKHSFEDTIEPVTEAKQRWGGRGSLLGGLDVDFIARRDEPAIRQRVREVLDVCMPGGGYCLGLGNWVTDYIPTENYLAVLDEGRKYATG